LVDQTRELPPIRPLVFQYELVRLRCPCCGKPRLADLPDGVTWSAFEARLEAHIATFAGVYRLSRRQVRQVVQEMFAIPISVGAVEAAIMRMSAVLKDRGSSCAATSRRPSRSTPMRPVGGCVALISACGLRPVR
jgi:transposase